MRIAYILILLMACSATLTAQSANRIEAIRLVQEGDNRIRTGDLFNAIFSYTHAIQTDVTFADAYIKRALLHEKMGNYNQASKDLTIALDINPYSFYIYDKRAKLKILAMDYKGAIDDINKAIALEGLNKSEQEQLVEDYILAQNFTLAVSLADSLSKTNKNDSYSLLLLALSNYNAAEYNAAEEQARKLVTDDSLGAMANNILGLIAMKRNNFSEAIKYLNTSLALNPGFEQAYYNRSIAYRMSDKKDLAQNDLNKAIELSKENSKIYFARALVRKELGDLQGSLSDYDMAIKNAPQYSDALYNRAYLKKFMGDYSGAIDDINTVISQNPAAAENYNMRGNIQLLFSNYKEAIDDYSKAISYKSDYAEAHYNRAIAYVMLYRINEACQDFDYAIILNYSPAELLKQKFCN
ncbi:MAG: tetratricopeptide repeat protein [Bacteroidetes bacterium]|nr:tetratricopeptide repeat protein [Bacteroidota bacterium]